MEESMSKAMDGSGLITYVYNYDNKQLSIDFSGYEYSDEAPSKGKERKGGINKNCYRNDASVFFFAANSYRAAYKILEKEISREFEKQTKIEYIGHRILPYFFSFRHSLELYLKGLHVALSSKYPKPEHKLLALLDSIYPHINSLEWKNSEYIDREGFSGKKKELINDLTKLKEAISKYTKWEPSAEYYRFLFKNAKKDMVLNNPLIEFNFTDSQQLFFEIDTILTHMFKAFQEMDIYIQSFF